MTGRGPLTVVAAFAAELPPARGGREQHALGPGAGSRALPDGRGPLVVTGSCGALVAGVERGTLALPRAVVGRDGTRRAPDAALRDGLLAAAREAGARVDERAIVEVAGLLDDDDGRARVARESGAAFADMESASWASAAERMGRPWAVVRFVTDAPGAGLGAIARLLRDAPIERAPTAVARGLLVKPWLLPDVLRFAARVSRSRRLVGRVLDAAR